MGISVIRRTRWGLQTCRDFRGRVSKRARLKGAVKRATPGCRMRHDRWARSCPPAGLALLVGVCYSFPLLVVCPSGRRCITRNDVWCKSQRGFKSLHHRTNENPSRFVSAGFCMPGLFRFVLGWCRRAHWWVRWCVFVRRYVLCFMGCVPLPGLYRCLLIRGWVKSYYAY